MTITKITYMQTFPTGSFANIKLGAEAEVGAREDITKAMTDLKKVVNDAFQAVNPEPRIDYSAIPGHPMSTISQKDLEQKLILMAELEAAKTSQEVTTIYNESPLSIRTDQEFFSAVLAAKERVKAII